MSNSLFEGARLEILYDENFAAHKLTHDQEGVTLYGDTPAERLKTCNWAQWCDQAAFCTRFCRLCGFPRDPIEEPYPDDSLSYLCGDGDDSVSPFVLGELKSRIQPRRYGWAWDRSKGDSCL